LVYDVKIRRVVEDNKEKIKALLSLVFHIKDAEVGGDDSITIKAKGKIPQEAQDEFRKIVERTVAGIKTINFEASEEENK